MSNGSLDGNVSLDNARAPGNINWMFVSAGLGLFLLMVILMQCARRLCCKPSRRSRSGRDATVVVTADLEPSAVLSTMKKSNMNSISESAIANHANHHMARAAEVRPASAGNVAVIRRESPQSESATDGIGESQRSYSWLSEDSNDLPEEV